MKRLANARRIDRRVLLRKIKGVSTVEYALILVAVVAIVGGAAVFLDDQFDVLFTELKTQVTEQKGVAAGLDDAPTTSGQGNQQGSQQGSQNT